ncbi:MAG: aspartate--tRNA ligase [Candidatus Woesearchaeota archaeon]
MVFTLKRTKNCNELRQKDIDNEVILNGWVHSRRDHGGIIFIDLRDRFGLTQIVFDPKFDEKSHIEAENLRREDVIAVKGKVFNRTKGMENEKLDTGKIEVYINSLEIVSKAQTPPIEIDDRIIAGDELRLKYRYLDLRRPVMQNNLLFRHNALKITRDFFNNNNFLEIDTPLLIKSTPEGARDYIVPSRVNAGKFYALPQSPQLYKQILMISGVDKYYQIAKCLRDEDLRADRQPEHSQVDFEMSFVDSQDIMNYVEEYLCHLFKKLKNIELKRPFKKLTYEESMDKYGTDKPDLRYGLEMFDVTEIVKNSTFQVFNNVIKNNGIIKCINPEYEFKRKEIDSLIDFCIKNGSKGMAWMRFTDKGLESNIEKFFSNEIKQELLKKINPKPNSILMFIADEKNKANKIISDLRCELAKRMNLIDDNKFEFCFITDFPLFTWNNDDEKWEPEHNMFSMPKKEHLKYLDTNPKLVKGDLFDIALNGIEIASGAIRVHDPKIQKKIMNIIGINENEARDKFGFLLEAYKYGAPVHGGMGIGFDRLIALMLKTNDIREVIAFPKNKNAQCPMDNSPGSVSEAQLKELHIKKQFIKKEINKN